MSGIDFSLPHSASSRKLRTFFSLPSSLPPHHGPWGIGFSDFEYSNCLVIAAQILYATKYGRTTRDLLIPQVAPHPSKKLSLGLPRSLFTIPIRTNISSLVLIASFHLKSSLLPSKSKRSTQSSNLVCRVAAPAALAALGSLRVLLWAY